MKVIGLTGGIGSGKSTVAKEFKKLGVPVYIADDASKKILATHPNAISKVIDLLGSEAYEVDNGGIHTPNKQFIGSKVFSDKSLLKSLNAVLHPLVRENFEEWLDSRSSIYVIYEAAILFESGGDLRCDEVITVATNEDERIKRVMLRDDATETQVRERLQNQWTDKQRAQKANYVIVNNNIQSIPIFVELFNDFMLK